MRTIYLPVDEDLLVPGYYWTTSHGGRLKIVQVFRPQWREDGWVISDGNEYTEAYTWDDAVNYKLVGPISVPDQFKGAFHD